MFTTLRQAMTWLHTWFGLVFGFILMAVFFFGSLSVFDREIDRWAIAETRFDPQPMPAFDAILQPAFAALRAHEAEYQAGQALVSQPLPPPEELKPADWGAYVTHRDPLVSIWAGFDLPHAKDPDGHNHVHGWATLDPRNGQPLSPGQLKLGSEFFYPLHYSLHLHWNHLGYWLVGLAALVMLAALVSGVIIHRKLFAELFTLRPHKHRQRSLLDAHNLSGVAALPFHFIFALSGLIIFAGIYLPVSDSTLRPLAKAHEEIKAARTGLPHKPAGIAAPLASVDAMMASAKARWAERGMPGEVGYLYLNHVGDANGYVSIFRAGSDRVTLVGQGVHFAASSGQLLFEEPAPGAIGGIYDFLVGLHLQHFEHWWLRWLYLFGGLAGCVCIATGILFFVEHRKRLHGSSPLLRTIDAIGISSISGMLLATAAVLVANRALPEAWGHWQEPLFGGCWLLALLHALWRSKPQGALRLAPAWQEQCWGIALLAVTAVVLNAITTGDHLLHTLSRGYWPVAGVDLALLVAALLAAMSARYLQRAALPARSPLGVEVHHG